MDHYETWLHLQLLLFTADVQALGDQIINLACIVLTAPVMYTVFKFSLAITETE